MEKIIREYHYILIEQRRLKANKYGEVTYTDHYPEGLKVDGTEDFSIERYRDQVVERVVYKPTGRINKGGKRMWEPVASVRSRNVKDCGALARMLFAGQEIKIRKY